MSGTRKNPSSSSTSVDDASVSIEEEKRTPEQILAQLHDAMGDLNPTLAADLAALAQQSAERIVASINAKKAPALTDEEIAAAHKHPLFKAFWVFYFCAISMDFSFLFFQLDQSKDGLQDTIKALFGANMPDKAALGIGIPLAFIGSAFDLLVMRPGKLAEVDMNTYLKWVARNNNSLPTAAFNKIGSFFHCLFFNPVGFAVESFHEFLITTHNMTGAYATYSGLDALAKSRGTTLDEALGGGKWAIFSIIMTLGNAYYNKLITPKYRDGLEFLLENKEDDWLHANVMVHHELSTPFKIFFESIVAAAGLRGLTFIFLAQDAQELLGWWLNPWVVGAAVTLHTIISRHKASYEGNYLPFKQCQRILGTILAEAKGHAPNASSQSIILAMLVGLGLDKDEADHGIAKETVEELVRLYDENNLRALTKLMVTIINDNTTVNQSCLRTVVKYPKDSMLSIAVVGAIGSGIGYAFRPYLESALGSNPYTLTAAIAVTGGMGILLGKLYASGEITRVEEEAALKYLSEDKTATTPEKKGSMVTAGFAHFINGVANFGLRGFAGAGQTFHLFYNLSGTTPESRSSTFVVTTGFGGNLFLAANSAKNFYNDVKGTLDDYAEWIGNSRLGKGTSNCCMRLFSKKPINEAHNEGSRLVVTNSSVNHSRNGSRH